MLRAQRVVETERTLAGVVKDVVTFVNGCSKLVKSADLTMTSGKAKVPPHSPSRLRSSQVSKMTAPSSLYSNGAKLGSGAFG